MVKAVPKAQLLPCIYEKLKYIYIVLIKVDRHYYGGYDEIWANKTI